MTLEKIQFKRCDSCKKRSWHPVSWTRNALYSYELTGAPFAQQPYKSYILFRCCFLRHKGVGIDDPETIACGSACGRARIRKTVHYSLGQIVLQHHSLPKSEDACLGVRVRSRSSIKEPPNVLRSPKMYRIPKCSEQHVHSNVQGGINKSHSVKILYNIWAPQYTD